MSKRPNPNDSSSTPASKRHKQSIEENEDGVGTESCSVAQLFSNEIIENKVTNVAVEYSRDGDYYIEDGSIILGVGNVLFKVHASQLKAHSTVFKDMFDMPLGEGKAQAEGTCDESPVVIPGVEPSQFRNLMKMFYCSPSDKLFLGLQTNEMNVCYSWGNFRFCSDIARLSHRFGMADMEQWARTHLKWLVRVGAEEIVRGASTDIPDPSLLLDVLQYCVITSNSRIARHIRNIIQCCYEKIANFEVEDQLFAFFRMPDLQRDDPCLHGFFFALLLGYKPTEWKKDPFTRKDRMALYSAQVHLTPYPPELMEGLDSPLFQKPTSFTSFFAKVWDSTTDRQCNEQCRPHIFYFWQSEFSELYYKEITDTNFRIAIQALTDIPSNRLRFAKKTRSRKCSGNRDCSQVLLDILDQDIEQVYARVATYYQEIE